MRDYPGSKQRVHFIVKKFSSNHLAFQRSRCLRSFLIIKIVWLGSECRFVASLYSGTPKHETTKLHDTYPNDIIAPYIRAVPKFSFSRIRRKNTLFMGAILSTYLGKESCRRWSLDQMKTDIFYQTYFRFKVRKMEQTRDHLLNKGKLDFWSFQRIYKIHSYLCVSEYCLGTIAYNATLSNKNSFSRGRH